MDILTEIDRNHNIRKHRVIGTITFDKLKSYLVDLYSPADYDNSLSSLWDLSQTNGIADLTSEQVRALVLLVSARWATKMPVRSALVVSQELEYGLARMYEIQLSSMTTNEVEVFRDEQTAVEWLKEEG